MSRAQATKKLLQQLGNAPALVDDPEQARKRRAQVVGRMAELMRNEAKQQRRRAQRRRTWLWVSWAAVAVLVVGAGWWMLRPAGSPGGPTTLAAARVTAMAGEVSVARAGHDEAELVRDEVPLSTTDLVRTGPAGRARMTLASGAVVQIEPGTELKLAARQQAAGSQHERVDLARGHVDLAVPKLAAGRSLSVRTPHADVLVRGTKFSVTVGPSGQGETLTTEVSVTEGVVVVRTAGQETSLEAGARWSSEPEPVAHEGTDVQPDEPVPDEVARTDQPAGDQDEREATTTAQQPSTGPSEPAGPSSTLAEENRLYAKALAARDRGDDRSVVAHLDELIQRYPSSTLLPAARLERSRALERLERSRDAARQDGRREQGK